jgi:hypothetical protein
MIAAAELLLVLDNSCQDDVSYMIQFSRWERNSRIS